MKYRLLRLLPALLLVALLGSCDLIYSGKNLFASLDGPDVGELRSATGTDLIDLLEESQGGEAGGFGATFVEAIQDDSGAAEEIYDNLRDIYTGAYDDYTQAAAAALAAEFVLAVTDAGAVVNNVVGAVVALTDTGDDITADDLIVALLGDVGTTSEADFVALARDLLKVADAYDALGAALVAGGSTELDLADGQSAVVALVFKEVLGAVQPPSATADEKAAALYAQLIAPSLDGDPANDPDDVDIGILFGSVVNLESVFETVVGDPADVPDSREALFAATGVTSLIGMING
jgi:hypothetical protein